MMLQAREVAYSSDGTKLAVSAFDRDYLLKRDKRQAIRKAFVVDTRSKDIWTIEDEFGRGTTAVAFSSDDRWLFVGSSNGKVFVYDIINRERSRVIDTGQENWVTSVRTNSKNDLLATCSSNAIIIWSLLTFERFALLDVTPQPSISAAFPKVVFGPNDTLLVGVFGDAIIRFWDARPFISRNGEPHINMVEYTPPDLTAIADDPANWPEWWQKCKINVPEGMVPNPDFGKCLRTVEQKLNCQGLRLAGTKGLDAKGFPAKVEKGLRMTLESTLTLGEWLAERGAILS